MTTTIETGGPFWNHRHLPVSMVTYFAKEMQDTGVVDYLNLAHVLSNPWPRYAWTEHVPSAEMMPDADSLWDSYMALALGAMAAPELNVLMGTNSMRQGPAENFQAMMTLASLTEGKAVCQIGTGEAYNVIPFGHRRREGLARLEDHLRLYRLLWDADAPFDFEGRVWSYRQAYAGTIRDRRPLFWAMGGGPKLRQIAARHADGWTTMAPGSFATVERFAAAVTEMKEEVERHGGDPDTFSVGLCLCMLINEDGDAIERVMDNPAVRWFSAMIARHEQSEWRDVGLEPVLPEGYQYSLEMLPAEVPRSHFDAVVERFDRRYMEQTYLIGSPKEIAEQLQPWIEAGATMLQPCDPSAIALEPEATKASFDQMLALYRILKHGDA